MSWFKKITIPNGETEEVTAYETWFVRWTSLHPYTHTYAEQKYEAEIFPTQEDAEKFATALADAFKLTKSNCFIDYIKVSKN